MKKKFLIALLLILSIIATLSLAQIPVPTKQGVNFVVRTYTIPLYIKILEFVDRDFRYRDIIMKIAPYNMPDEDRVMAIFKWCVANIKHQPEGIPVVDDHPYSIIIRGYGIEDQLEDIFTILCTYAGFDSFYKVFRFKDGKAVVVSFIKYGDGWHIFSVWGGVYPVDGSGKPATTDYVRLHAVSLKPFSEKLKDLDFANFLEDLGRLSYEATSLRGRNQSPVGRALCYFNGLFNNR